MLLPFITTGLVGRLDEYIPRTLDVTDFETLVHATQEFEVHLQAIGWTRENTLQEWCSRAGETWGQRHAIDILDQVRTMIRRGITPGVTVHSSPGAVEFQNDGDEWSWDDDWVESPGPTRRPRRSRRGGMRETRMFECTSLPSGLLALLGILLQEYTHLPSLAVLNGAQRVYPSLLRDVFAIFRAGGSLHASFSEETPLRLVNDCFYVAGEIGLMGLGMGQLGLLEITTVLEEISATMDLCGVHWRERYLVISLFMSSW
jgi:hypothetical protein